MADALTDAGIEQVAQAARRHVGDELVPGLVALVARGDDVYVEALGHLSIGGPPAQRDSLFRIASTTKPITAAATLALVDEGLIALDEPVDAFGWDGGFGSSWLVDPQRDLTVIVLTQRMFESPETPRVHRDIQAAAYGASA